MGQTLATTRLILREFVPDDAGALAAIYADPETSQWLGDGSPRDRAATEREIERLRGLYASHGFGLWAVVLKETGELIGQCGLQPLDDGSAVALSYALSRAHRGKGYSTEAARAVLAHAFGPLGLDRVVAVAQPVNDESVRVMEKIGMKRVGTEVHYGKTTAVYEIGRRT